MEGDSRTLLLAFGGMAGSINMPPFEFFSMTTEMPVKRLFVRDLRQAWYHGGIPGHGSTIPEVAESLKRLIARRDIDQLVVAGSSAGGYAALAFGTLLGANRVLCFAPQTTIDLNILSGLNDHRWDEKLKRLEAASTLDPHWTDLRKALPKARVVAGTRYDLYFDNSFHADRLHAEHLAEIKGVRLHRLQGAGHGIARKMRETGELELILRRALSAPD